MTTMTAVGQKGEVCGVQNRPQRRERQSADIGSSGTSKPALWVPSK